MLKTNSFIQKNNVFLIKEWEYTGIPRNATPDFELIKAYENKLGDPTLWNVLLCDRRVFFGRYCKSKQDYRPRFGYHEQLLILEQALVSIKKAFKKVRPDVVLSFGTSVMGDYLIYLFAKSYGIPYLQLKATKIENYLAFHDAPDAFSSFISQQYVSDNPIPKAFLEKAHSYLASVVKKGLKYEGAILSERSRLLKRLTSAPINLFKNIPGAMKDYCDPVIRRDAHIPGKFRSALNYNIYQPLNAYYISKHLRKHAKYIERNMLEKSDPFIFFPLHFEPEVSIQIFGRPYQNQIELIRNIALSVPVGRKVVVKEHPRSIGFRPYSYYQKLLDIPNVFLIDPYIKAHQIIPYSQLVAVISGSIGFEAAIMGKPVLSFGNAAYNILPETMVSHCSNLNQLGKQIKKLSDRYAYDEEALLRYAAIIMKESVPIDLYSAIIGKKHRNYDQKHLTKSERIDIGYLNLAQYCQRYFKKIGVVNTTEASVKNKEPSSSRAKVSYNG